MKLCFIYFNRIKYLIYYWLDLIRNIIKVFGDEYNNLNFSQLKLITNVHYLIINDVCEQLAFDFYISIISLLLFLIYKNYIIYYFVYLYYLFILILFI